MRIISTIILLLILNVTAFSQIQNPSPNLKPKKILFTYLSVPNFYFEKNKVYGDSTSLSKEFQNVKINFSISPLDSTKTIAYVDKKDISLQNLIEFSHKVFHSFTQINYEYNAKSNKIEYHGSICKSNLCNKVYKDFFDEKNMTGTDIFLSEVSFNEKKTNVYLFFRF